MDRRIEAFETWAPYGLKWTQWAKPVLFSTLPEKSVVQMDELKIEWTEQSERNTMIIVDTEGRESIREGLAYAKLGYRPVPLYNGVRGDKHYNLIDGEDLQNCLFAGARILKELDIPPDAPPVFLLDSKRMQSKTKKRGVFDNRWTIFPQDMPSSNFLKQNRITKIIVHSNQIQNDLAHILYRYQKDGLLILHSKSAKHLPERVKIRKPSRFKNLGYRFLVMLKLKRNSTGGFGSFIPEQSGTGYYGIG
jgi:hypothetical protein